jgi:hypothetical protein
MNEQTFKFASHPQFVLLKSPQRRGERRGNAESLRSPRLCGEKDGVNVVHPWLDPSGIIVISVAQEVKVLRILTQRRYNATSASSAKTIESDK